MFMVWGSCGDVAAINGTNSILEIWHESIVIDRWMDGSGWQKWNILGVEWLWWEYRYHLAEVSMQRAVRYRVQRRLYHTPGYRVIGSLEPLPNMSDRKASNTRIQEYCQLLLEGDTIWSFVAMSSELHSDISECISTHTQLTLNVIRVTQYKLDDPSFIRKYGCMVWLWVPWEILGKEIYH